MIAARQEARRNFDQNRRLAVDTSMQINHAVEVASILRHNIVQGAREDGDESAKWRMWNQVPPDNPEGPLLSRLRLSWPFTARACCLH